MATAKVTRGPAVEAVYASGTVEPVSWAKVQPLRTGRIASVEAFEGDEVKTGQILMRLDDRELRASVAQLEAELRFLRSELDRVSELARRGVTTTQVEERARSQMDQAAATLNAARQRVEDFLLRAPMDGTVLRRDGEVGEIARPEDVLFWIGRASPLRIEAEVDEEDIPLVAVGQPALIKADAFPGRILDGTVADITPKGDPVNKSYRVRIGLPPDTPLRIGMTVESNIVVRREDAALLVPQGAVVGRPRLRPGRGACGAAGGRDGRGRAGRRGDPGRSGGGRNRRAGPAGGPGRWFAGAVEIVTLEVPPWLVRCSSIWR